MESRPLPPGQQLAARGKWPQVGEATPSDLPPDAAATWQIDVAGLIAAPRSWSLDDLRRLPRAERPIDIHCVTRWSKPAVRFAGVLLADLLAEVGVNVEAKFISFIAHSTRNHDTSLPIADALALGTLIAWEVEGEPLAVDHGGPVRVVVPKRYFYKSLKWLRTIRLLERDALGFWEREAGYHNTADPWLQQRYMAPALSRLEVRAVLKSRNFAGRELRSIDCRGHDLAGLNAAGAILRDADFRECPLAAADFTGANLSNARFAGAHLQAATFVGADVEGADFAGCDLRGCDFRGASLFGSTFRANNPSHPTRFDAATRFDAVTIEALMPEEQSFVREHVQQL